MLGAVIDGLEQRTDIDGQRVGVVGQSLGALYAPLAAALLARLSWLSIPRATMSASIVGLVVLVAAAGIVYTKAVKPAPPDNAQLTELKFDSLMGSRYTEILLARLRQCAD